MAGPEKKLSADLVRVVRGQKVDSAKNYLDEHQPRGSGNWRTLAMGIEAWRARTSTRQWILDEFVIQRTRFMQHEVLPRIYMIWQTIPVAAVLVRAILDGDDELEAACRRWLRALWSAAALSAGGSPTKPVVTLTGSRSWRIIPPDKEGHHIRNHPMDSVLRWALDIENGPPPKTVDADFTDAVITELMKKKAGWKSGDVLGLLPHERETLRGVLAGTAGADDVAPWLADHRPSVPFLLVRTTANDGACVALKAPPSVSTDTLPVLMWRAAAGRLEYLAPLDGDRSGDHSAHGEYPVGGPFRAFANPGETGISAPALAGTERWRVTWGGAAPPPGDPPPLPPPPPGEDPPVPPPPPGGAMPRPLPAIRTWTGVLKGLGDTEGSRARGIGIEINRLITETPQPWPAPVPATKTWAGELQILPDNAGGSARLIGAEIARLIAVNWPNG